MDIVKRVVGIGNGAAVYVPREYKGKEVIVILPEGIREIRRRVLYRLIDFMPNILGVYLYGSYARNEQGRDSDIDVLIITNEKQGREEIKKIFDDIDIRVLTLQNIKKAIENFPALILPILKEARAFLNPALLEELKNSKFDVKKFSWNFQDIRRILKIIKGFIEIDEKDIAPSHIYSLIMRVRILCMIESLLKNKIFSNKAVKKVLLDYGLTEKEFGKFYNIYQRIRKDKEVDEKINKEEILELIEIVKRYSKKLENETKKEAGKGN